MATTNPTELQLYPASTEDSKSIPMDIMRPLALQHVDVPATDYTDFELAEGTTLVSLFSLGACILEFGRTKIYPFAGTAASAVFVPPYTVMTVAVPPGVTEVRAISMEALDDGYLMVQYIQKWAGLGLRRQSSTR